VYCFIFTFILITSLFLGNGINFVVADEISREERNWEFVNHDSWGSNYSPQKEINKNSIEHLELKWTFPFPQAKTFALEQPGGVAFEGAITPPIIVDGDVYVASNMKNIYSFDAETGVLQWTNIYKHNWEEARVDLPEIAGGAPHIHGLEYVDGMLYTSNLNCSIQGVNAESGELEIDIQKICKDVEGNNYKWPGYTGIGRFGSPSHPGAVYEKEGIMIAGFTSGGGPWGGGRSFIDGYDLEQNPPERIWRTFLAPPGEGDPEWALRECHKGWFFSYKAWKEEGRLGIPCSEVPTKNLINDWGVPKHFTSGVSAIWGQMSVDEETGIVYLGTGNQGGWPNQTHTMGPNLYAATTMAIDSTTGEIIWWYQQVPRDMVEGDSSWNTMLAKVEIDGELKKVIFKFSATGLAWALDAATGEPLWIFEAPFLEQRIDPDGVFRGRTAGHPCIGCEPNTQDGYWNDPMSYYDMQEKKWLNYPEEDSFYWIPSRSGESDMALDPDLNSIFIPVAAGVDMSIQPGPVENRQVSIHLSQQIAQPKNVTLYSIDAHTGKIKWSYFIDQVAYRGGVITSGGLLFIPVSDGYLYIFNAENGELLRKMNFGTSLVVQPTIGKTADGESRLFIITGGRSADNIGGITKINIPGAIMSFGLSDEYVKPITQEETNNENNNEESDEKIENKEEKETVNEEIEKTDDGESVKEESNANMPFILGAIAGVIVLFGILWNRKK
jgi:outer membrane protein assembly factor BamB